jgi:phenylalanyl-tRNA synthetase alpha chain
MKEMLQELRSVAVDAILNAADAECLEALRIQYLGKKGDLTKLLKMMGKLDPAERPAMGQLANQVRAEVENAIYQCIQFHKEDITGKTAKYVEEQAG